MVGKVTPNTMLSASRLPAVLGHSKWSTANDELMATIHAIDGHEPESISKEAFDWGNMLEGPILKEAAKRLNLKKLVLKHPAHFATDIPLACSLDGLASGKGQDIHSDPDKGIFVIGQDSIKLDGVGVLEAKLTSFEAEDMPPLWRGPIQLQAQMMIMGAKWGAVCTLYKGLTMRVFLFAPHQATQDAITTAVIDFDRRLTVYKDTGEIDSYPIESNSDANLLYAQGADETIDLPDSAEASIRSIFEAKAEIKKLEEVIDAETLELKLLLEKAERGRTSNYEVAWPMRSYKATAERITPAAPARTIRLQTISIKETQHDRRLTQTN
jgi:predicted phage-related endonuclease